MPSRMFFFYFFPLIFCMAFEEVQQLFRMKNKTRSECGQMLTLRFQEMQNYLWKLLNFISLTEIQG